MLSRNQERFAWCESKAWSYFRQKEYDRAVTWVSLAAYCAWNAHAGFYRSASLENILLRIATDLAERTNKTPIQFPESSGRRWLQRRR